MRELVISHHESDTEAVAPPDLVETIDERANKEAATDDEFDDALIF